MIIEKFLSLPIEKQKTIIDAAMLVFGTSTYKKASINDIAVKAGISKSMIFYYFKAKRDLYNYLLKFSWDSITNALNESFDKNVSDFFEKIRIATKIKMSVLYKYPSMISFLTNAMIDTDSEIQKEIQNLYSRSGSLIDLFVFEKLDNDKFKEGVDPHLVFNILQKFVEGYLPKTGMPFELDSLLKEFDACLNLMKNNFYKEEYL